MLDILLLRLDAPLVSFGGPAVDAYRVVQPMPALSTLVGLIGNALGLDHRDAERLERLQSRLRFAVRCDRPGQPLRDYQTVDLGQDFMLASRVAWTTRGRIEARGESKNSEQTHIRYRDYRADSIHTLALTLDPPGEDPDLSAVEAALREPERPLFIGRKCCLPAAPLLLERRQAASLLAALIDLPLLPGERNGLGADEGMAAWWPEKDPTESSGAVKGARDVPVTDQRDWANQVHCGRRLVRAGLIAPGGGAR